MPSGAEVGDGGFSGILSTNSKTILATSDSIEKVIGYYSKWFDEAKKDKRMSVVVQDDSEGRPLTLRVFVVSTADTSTTLVISRGTGEKETHIAWSQFWHQDVAK